MRLSALYSLVYLALVKSFADAGLYPTRPVKDTIFHGAAWNTISWIDSPDSACTTPLEALGRMKIDLWIDGDAPVSLALTLARGR